MKVADKDVVVRSTDQFQRFRCMKLDTLFIDHYQIELENTFNYVHPVRTNIKSGVAATHVTLPS